MRLGRHPANDHLNDYWNALERNAPPDEVRRLGDKLDPARKAALDQARSRYQRERPDPAFLARLETDLMNAFATIPAGTIPLPRQNSSPSNGRIAPRTPIGCQPSLNRANAANGQSPSWQPPHCSSPPSSADMAGSRAATSNQPSSFSPPPQATPGSGWTHLKGNAGPTGQPIELWRFQAGGPCNQPPIVVGETTFAGCGDGILYALTWLTAAKSGGLPPMARSATV